MKNGAKGLSSVSDAVRPGDVASPLLRMPFPAVATFLDTCRREEAETVRLVALQHGVSGLRLLHEGCGGRGGKTVVSLCFKNVELNDVLLHESSLCAQPSTNIQHTACTVKQVMSTGVRWQLDRKEPVLTPQSRRESGAERTVLPRRSCACQRYMVRRNYSVTDMHPELCRESRIRADVFTPRGREMLNTRRCAERRLLWPDPIRFAPSRVGVQSHDSRFAGGN